MFNVFLVAVGGAIGATGRYLMGKVPMVDVAFPINTLVINIIGCFVIGLTIGLTSRFDIATGRTALFMKTGVCGGFSTLAAVSAESLSMMEHGRVGAALLYCVGTFTICVIATWIGTCIAKIGA